MLKKNVAIVIPAYNEEKNLLKLVKSIRKNIDSYIIIIDDSINLDTHNLFKKNKFKKLLFIHRKKKLGRGSAVIFGLKKMIKKKNMSCFIEMDADFSHNPFELKRHIKKFRNESLDLLICSRYLPKSKILNWPPQRKILSKLTNILARILLGVPVSDYTNGFRFYSKKATKLILSKCNKISENFIILSEIILVLHTHKCKISETDTTFKNRLRGESSVNLGLLIDSMFGLIKLFLLKILKKI
jgi:dolichol-phosphate mannosyltransferase